MDAIKTLDQARATLEELSHKVANSTRFSLSEMRGIAAKVYSIQLAGSERERLLDYIIAERKREGASRAFIFRKSSTYLLLMRYVFPSVEDRTTVSRYAGALDELAAMGTPTNEFMEAVKANGGISELYCRSRGRKAKRQIRQKLNLSRPVELITGRVTTLVCIPSSNGVMKVLSYEISDETTPLQAAE